MHSVITFDGHAGDTFTQTSTNAKASLTAANLLNDNNRRAIAVYITVETQNIKFTVGDSDPVSSGLGHVLVKDLVGIYIRGSKACKDFQFISASAGSHGVLQITPFFDATK